MSSIKIYSYVDDKGTQRLSYVPRPSLSKTRWREVSSPVLYKPLYGDSSWCGSCRMSKDAVLLYRILDMDIDSSFYRSLKTVSAKMKQAAENLISFSSDLMLGTDRSPLRSFFFATANGKLYVQVYNYNSERTELVTIKNMRVTSRVKVIKPLSFEKFTRRAIKAIC